MHSDFSLVVARTFHPSGSGRLLLTCTLSKIVRSSTHIAAPMSHEHESLAKRTTPLCYVLCPPCFHTAQAPQLGCTGKAVCAALPSTQAATPAACEHFTGGQSCQHEGVRAISAISSRGTISNRGAYNSQEPKHSIPGSAAGGHGHTELSRGTCRCLCNRCMPGPPSRAATAS